MPPCNEDFILYVILMWCVSVRSHVSTEYYRYIYLIICLCFRMFPC